jgi:hypothetical protein
LQHVWPPCTFEFPIPFLQLLCSSHCHWVWQTQQILLYSLSHCYSYDNSNGNTICNTKPVIKVVSTQTIATTKRYHSDDVCLSAITWPHLNSFDSGRAPRIFRLSAIPESWRSQVLFSQSVKHS